MARSLELNLYSLARTREVGNALGRRLPPQALCLFFGDLATGKTTFIKAVCEGLGIAPRHVISPTYTLVNIYPGRLSVYHVDLFRIEQADALLELDRVDWINPEGVTLIEWPRVALPLLDAEAALELHLTDPAAPPERRLLRLHDPAGAYGAVMRELEEYAQPA
ncbi:MAG: tRNA (adenosine(37)-N6)-threonylcarbamoyltransferase complex ATPase subunit type 1 TsaE [SAR324 cluster bacterium]|nr:tRNA (adenosine(37)-N6)-threonylcarbamoyltransferase complex ATPase subunit type 1 TsaE [SAR324 cluster bacterium]